MNKNGLTPQKAKLVKGLTLVCTFTLISSFGFALWANLTSGYYEIKESTMPSGYIISGDGAFYIRMIGSGVELLQKDLTKKPKDWPVIQTDNMVVNVSQASETTPATLTVENTPGAALPSSGGPGTTWIYLLGTILLLGSAILLAARRRTARP